MIKLIVGLKGSGKTKAIVDLANAKVAETKGCIVFVEKGCSLLHEVKHQVRLLNAEEYHIDDASKLYGFVAGNFGSNFDVTDIFIDSTLKICGNVEALSAFLDNVAAFSATHPVNFVMTISASADDIPERFKQFI